MNIFLLLFTILVQKETIKIENLYKIMGLSMLTDILLLAAKYEISGYWRVFILY